MNEQELDKALDDIASANPEGLAAAEAPCDIYKRIRPILTSAMPILKVIAPKVAAALTTLMALLDSLCQIQA